MCPSKNSGTGSSTLKENTVVSITQNNALKRTSAHIVSVKERWIVYTIIIFTTIVSVFSSNYKLYNFFFENYILW